MVEKILDFLANWYVLFIIISLLLIFSLIGYFVTKRRKKNSIFKLSSEQNNNINIADIPLDNNVSLNEALNKNKTVNKDNRY